MPQNYFDNTTPTGILKNGLVSGLYDQLASMQLHYIKIDRYMAGDHELRFATEKFTNAFGRLFRAFADNYCPRVISALSDYLQLKAWTTENEASKKTLADWWDEELMDMKSGKVHSNAFRYGDGYVIVAEDTVGRTRIYNQDPRKVRVLYDTEQPDVVILAIKLWQRIDKAWRLNIYIKGSIYRFIAPAKAGRTSTGSASLKNFIPYEDIDIEAVEDIKGDVIPVWHFANDPEGDGSGLSELKQIFPLQDALNKTLCDLLVAMEFQAYRQRYATGIEVTINEDGTAKPPFVAAVDRMLFTGNKDARFGEFGVVDVKQFLDVAEGFRTEIARLSKIPIHHLMMSDDFASGEALKTAENPLLQKVRDRQISWGNVWEQIALYKLGIDPLNQSNVDDVEAQWEDVSPRSRAEEATADVQETIAAKNKLGLGVPQAKVLEELGYDPDDVAKWIKENGPVPTGIEALTKMFNGGGVGFSGPSNGVPGNPGAGQSIPGAAGAQASQNGNGNGAGAGNNQ